MVWAIWVVIISVKVWQECSLSNKTFIRQFFPPETIFLMMWKHPPPFWRCAAASGGSPLLKQSKEDTKGSFSLSRRIVFRPHALEAIYICATSINVDNFLPPAMIVAMDPASCTSAAPLPRSCVWTQMELAAPPLLGARAALPLAEPKANSTGWSLSCGAVWLVAF